MHKGMKLIKNLSIFFVSLIFAWCIDSFLAAAVNGRLHMPKLIGSFGVPKSLSWFLPFTIIIGIYLCFAFYFFYSRFFSRFRLKLLMGTH